MADQYRRERVLTRLQSQARHHRIKSRANADMSCGASLGDHIRGNDTQGHFDKYQSLLRRLARIDPGFPEHLRGRYLR